MTLLKRKGAVAALALAAAFSVAVLGGVLPASASAPAAQIQTTKAAKPTVVLVHGAFADSSGWNRVATGLRKHGFPVLAFSNPLRGPL
ncbi:lipase family protein [Cellulomonas edaphi]|uniref:Alpha/beta hydrolase n=1 Tax=Cellulomonas edaphi TaxID=3053468 RepID=A0ABT7S3B6_9CELL|nr:hypothetical protein [Cellulomons edaphi]MDM7830108.1 hypothetical protein [Cellulomons edaphi]